MKILIVDDDATVISTYTELLEMHGYKVLTAKSGDEGLECWKKHRDNISLVVSDNSMPGMNGDKMIEAMLEIDPSVNVIMQSCNKPDELKHIQIPGLKIYRKTFVFAEILSLIRDSLPATC